MFPTYMWVSQMSSLVNEEMYISHRRVPHQGYKTGWVVT